MGRKPVLTRVPDRIRAESEPIRGIETQAAAGYGTEEAERDESEEAIETATGTATADEAVPGFQDRLDALINTIPGEVLVLWAGLEGAAELYGLSLVPYALFLVVAAIATPVYVYRSLDRPDLPSPGDDSALRWWQVANFRWQALGATAAFLVWVYYLGGPFEAAGLHDAAVATSLVIVYPVLVVVSPYWGSLILYKLFGPDGRQQPEAPAG